MQREYKTYNDLEWREHHLATAAKRLDPQEFPMLAENKDAKHAVMFFDNGYGISVIKDCPLLTMESKFECAVLRQSPDCRYGLDYKTGIADDVIRMDAEDVITDIMIKIQDLPPPSRTKGRSMTGLKCPFCGERLDCFYSYYRCNNDDCRNAHVWMRDVVCKALIDGKKAQQDLEFARNTIKKAIEFLGDDKPLDGYMSGLMHTGLSELLKQIEQKDAA